MTARPSVFPDWATNANYPVDAAPESGTATKIAPTSGQATHGWRPDQIPPAQEANYHPNLVGEWIRFLDEQVVSPVVNISPFSGFTLAGWEHHFGGFDFGWLTSVAPLAHISYGIPTQVGRKITSITFEISGDGVTSLTGDILVRAKGVAVPVSLGVIAPVVPGIPFQDVVVNVTDHTIADGDVYWMWLEASLANMLLGAIRVTYAP